MQDPGCHSCDHEVTAKLMQESFLTKKGIDSLRRPSVPVCTGMNCVKFLILFDNNYQK
jgi:hypothetical protein